MKLVYLVILSVPIIMTILVFPEHINNPGLSKGTDITLRQMKAILVTEFSAAEQCL